MIEGLEVLRSLAVSTEPMGSRAMARQLGLNPTRVNRLLKTLGSLGLARQTDDRKYLPGPALHVLSVQAIYGSGLLRKALPHLEGLRRFGTDVALGVLWQRQVCYLYHARPGAPAAAAMAVTGLFPAERSGIGLPLLAALPAEQVEQLYADHHTPAQMRALLKQLEVIRQAGHVYLQRDPGGSTDVLGVPVGASPFAGIALAGVIERQKIPTMVAAMQQAAADIAAE